jgi:dolichyl-diphosphooligosaccharide--protein glycosyltransferase
LKKGETLGAREKLGKLGSALKKLGNLRPKISHATLMSTMVISLILLIAFVVRILPIRWGMELSEFDPFSFYRFADYLTRTSIASWINLNDPYWHTIQSWYPFGVNIATVGYPGLAMAGAFLYEIASLLGIGISLKYFLILLPPAFGAITCLVAYFLGKDIAGKSAGILAALFLALNPSYIGRTSLGFFDNESMGILAILLIILFFLRSLDVERPLKSALFYMVGAGLSVGFICAQWGASMYPIDMVALFAFLAIILRRYSRRLLLSYSVTFGIGLFIAVHVPKLGTPFLTSSVVLPIAGVFILLLLTETLHDVKTLSSKITYTALFFAILIGGAALLSLLGVIHSPAGKFVSLLDPFLRALQPIYLSVQENHITAWPTIYYDYGVGLLFILFGLALAIRNLTNRNLFLTIYAITGLYFAMSMVRLTVMLAPAFCILWAIGVTGLIKPFLTVLREVPKISVGKKQVGRVGREFSGVVVLMIFVLLTLTIALPYPRVFNAAYQPVTILSDSTGFGPTTGPMTEWVDACTWMRTQLPLNTVLVSWWDYGYWITIEGNQTSVVDNSTFNTTQIALVGAIFMSNQTQSIKILKDHFNGTYGPPSYIIVFGTFSSSTSSGTTTYIPYGYGDEGKWRWFVQISGNYTSLSNGKPANGKDALFGNYSIGYDVVNETSSTPSYPANKVGQSTTFYKLLYYACDTLLENETAATAAQAVNMTKIPGTSSYYFTLAATFPSTPTNYGGVYPIVAVYKINYKD